MSEELNPITREEMFLAKAAGQNVPALTPITRVERFLQNLIDHIKSIGSGGGTGGAAPDWNAAEGQPGHILNRPFYSEYGMKTLLEETTLTASAETDGNGALLEEFLDLTGISEVEVTYNGTKYVCPVQETIEETPSGIATMWTFGNIGVLNGDGEDTGEPFGVMCGDAVFAEEMGVKGLVAPLDGSTEFTISIVGTTEIVHPIPEKYIPDSARKVFVTVEKTDSGEWMADKTYYEITEMIVAGIDVNMAVIGAFDEDAPTLLRFAAVNNNKIMFETTHYGQYSGGSTTNIGTYQTVCIVDETVTAVFLMKMNSDGIIQV